jgi:hypothetical protein
MNNNLITVAKQRVVLDCIFLHIYILLFIEHNRDVSPENVIVCQCRPCVTIIAVPVVVESPAGIV